MSAGFDVAGQTAWGSNGSVQLYLETLARHAADRCGPDDRLAAFFQEERECWFTGKVVFLDEVLIDPEARRRFLEVFDAATGELLAGDEFSEVGREWVRGTMGRLRGWVASGIAPA